MNRLKTFTTTSLIGGLTVVLPVVILYFVGSWLFRFVRGLVQPLTIIVFGNAQPSVVLDGLALLLIFAVCFLIGIAVRTRWGRFIHGGLETYILNIAPGYSLVKETVLQFLGKSKAPFSQVALVQVFDADVLMTAFVTDRYPGGYTVFVPTGPNPTSGNIYHIPEQRVHLVNTPVEVAVRSVISCGADSAQMVSQVHQGRLGEAGGPAPLPEPTS